MNNGDDDIEVLSVDDDLDLEEAMDEALGAVESSQGDEDAAARVEADTDPVAGLEAEIRQLREQNLRALADLENYRKRVARERVEERRYAGQSVLREVLDVKDNLVRALQSSGTADDLRVGVEMTLRQLDQVLENAGVRPVEALDRPFDPAVHEAVQRLEQGDVEEPAVVEEMQPGYRLHERLLRPSRVVVAVPASGAGEDDGGGKE